MMRFSQTTLPGAVIVDPEPRSDARGHFARLFCRDEFAAHGLRTDIVQANVSVNRSAGTLRGLHFQYPPAAETKYVRCSKGSILDVIVDLRPQSPTYLSHFATVLTAENGRGLYIPERFAHGLLTLQDDTEVSYLAGGAYTPELEGGLPFDDPRLAITWPSPVRVISDKDRQWRPLHVTEAELIRRMGAGETMLA